MEGRGIQQGSGGCWGHGSNFARATVAECRPALVCHRSSCRPCNVRGVSKPAAWGQNAASVGLQHLCLPPLEETGCQKARLAMCVAWVSHGACIGWQHPSLSPLAGNGGAGKRGLEWGHRVVLKADLRGCVNVEVVVLTVSVDVKHRKRRSP